MNRGWFSVSLKPLAERRVSSEQVIDRFAVHGQTTTSIVQSAPVAARGLALPGES